MRNVEAAGRWYRTLLDLGSGHGGSEYERVGTDDDVVLQLHGWHADDHEHLGDPDDPSRGNGVLVWFQVDDFDAALARADQLGATVIDGPLVNPNAHQRELWVRDLDGYTVVVAGRPGDLGSDPKLDAVLEAEAQVLVRRWWDEVWRDGRLDVLDEIITDPFTRHGSLGTQVVARAEYKTKMRQFQRTLHRAETDVQDMAVSDDRVWVRASSRGLNRETGEVALVSWLMVARVADGRFAEIWISPMAGVTWD